MGIDDIQLELSRGIDSHEECGEVIRFGGTGNDVHKLDVLRSREINHIMKLYITVWGSCIAYIVVSAILACTMFFTWQQFKVPASGRLLHIRATQFPLWYSWLDSTIPILMSFCNLSLAIGFTIRVTGNNHRRITEEQFWVVVLLITSAITTIPIEEILNIHDELIVSASGAVRKWGSNVWVHRIRGYVFVLQTWSATVSSLFYLWASAHTYGILKKPNKGHRWKKWYTHAPKILAFLLYQTLSLYGALAWNFYVGKIPLTTLPAFLIVSRTIGYYPSARVLLVFAYTLLESFFLMSIWARVLKTYKVLNEADYLKYRSKQISFRFFVFNNVLYNFTALVSEVFLHLVVPKNKTLMYLEETPPLSFNSNQSCIASLAVFNTAYLVISAYVHLPPESSGLKGWILGDGHICNPENTLAGSESVVMPLTLKARETSRTSVSVSSFLSVGSQHRDSVVMETHCELFNFAWLAYEWHRMPELLDHTAYKVKKYIYCKEKDIHVLVIDCVDRIVVSFKGTTSLKNIRTDLRIMPVPVHEYLPTIGSDIQEEMSDVVNSAEWTAAFTHAGFTEAYTMICGELMDTLGSMMRKEKRTVMLTGHSLGGALATLCALDVRLSLGLDDDEILTVSFGSPRCGNSNFQFVYDKLIPLHWRVCLNRDVITGLPKFGYIHSGRCVLLTTNGKMYVDPSHLDYMLMTAEVQSTYFHKKPAYMIALKAFCKRHLKSYQPQFWSFPIPAEYRSLWKEVNESLQDDSRSGSA